MRKYLRFQKALEQSDAERNEDRLHLPKLSSNFRLRHVSVITRHGLRTPLSRYPSFRDDVWHCHPLSERISFSSEHSFAPPALQKSYIADQQTLPGSCHLGQLLPQGYSQLHALGCGLRGYLVDDTGLLPARWSPELSGRVAVRSTDIPRTLQSAHALLLGLWPPGFRDARGGDIGVTCVETKRENMYPRADRCARFKALKRAIETSAEYAARERQRGELKARLEAALGRSFTSWAGLHNTLAARDALGLPRVPGIGDAEVEAVAREADWVMETRFADREMQRLGIGPFVGDVLEGLRGGKLLCLYSGHDNTLGPLLHALGVMDGCHPPMAAFVMIEVWEDATRDGRERVVRVVNNGEVMRMRQFGGREVVPWREFTRFLEEQIIPRDFVEECEMPL